MTNTTDEARGLVNVIRELIVNLTGREEGFATTKRAEEVALRVERIAALDVLTDLRDRCQRAVTTLAQEEGDTTGNLPTAAHRRARLTAKRDGVKLALSYIDETIRGLS